jgi:hypothetical protein
LRNYHPLKVSKTNFAIRNTEKTPKAVLSAKNYAFDDLKTSGFGLSNEPLS